MVGCIVLLLAGISLAFGLERIIEKREAEAQKEFTVGGIHDIMISEPAVIEDINRAQREITVKLLDQNNIYVREGDENPYDKEKVVLEYSEKKNFMFQSWKCQMK